MDLAVAAAAVIVAAAVDNKPFEEILDMIHLYTAVVVLG